MLLVVATSCGCGVSYASPEATVNAALDAKQALDADKELGCMVPEAVTDEMRQVTREVYEELKRQGVSVSIVNRDISVVSQTEDSATVSVSYDVKFTVEGETQTASDDATWTLVKRDGKWLIAGFA